jgi:hypothetical protein
MRIVNETSLGYIASARPAGVTHGDLISKKKNNNKKKSIS